MFNCDGVLTAYDNQLNWIGFGVYEIHRKGNVDILVIQFMSKFNTFANQTMIIHEIPFGFQDNSYNLLCLSYGHVNLR